MIPIMLSSKSTILIHYICLWHDNSAAKAFYGRTGLCIILALRVVVAERHTPAIDRVVTTVYEFP